ncbi:MAG: hypothetical protein FD181_3427 [Prolixibacteraceae bacterium]|nr:MAG: hypothetical protein FD181_3427 [Prolixibacteraceae bacterium]
MRILIILCFLILIGCKQSINESKLSNSVSYKIEVPIEQIGSDNFVKSAEYIFLEEKYLIGKMGRILMFENVIYIHDEMSDRLIAFSPKGKYLFKIDEKGKGPMEYLNLTDFTIDENGKFILIYDSYGHKLLKFSILQRKFVEEQTMGFHPIAFAWKDNSLFFYNPYTINYPRENQYHFSLIVLSEVLKNEKRYFKISKELGSFMSNPNRKGFFYGDGLFFLNRFDNVVYSLTKDSIYPHCQINFENNEDFDSALDDAISKGTRDTDWYKRCASEIQHYCESENVITFNYLRDSKLYSVIFSKQTNEIVYHSFSHAIISPSMFSENIPVFIFPSYVNKNYFISELPFELLNLLLKNKKFIESFDEKITDKELIEKFKNYDENSNPVLIFSEFKL